MGILVAASGAGDSGWGRNLPEYVRRPRGVCRYTCDIRRVSCVAVRESGRTDALYTTGDTPTHRLKARSNVRTSRKPDAYAKRAIGVSPTAISSLARLTRKRRTHAVNESPTFDLK